MISTARVVVAGEPEESGLRNSLIAALRALGCAVDVLDLDLRRLSPAWLASAAFRQPILGRGYRRKLRRRADALAGNGRVDLVLVFKGPMFDPSLIDHLRRRFESPVVCWNPDSPFDKAIANRGAWIRRTIGAYDAYVTWSGDVAERLNRVARRVLVIPFAWDPGTITPVAGDGVAAGRIVFVGTGTSGRSAVLRSLSHLRPVVFGTRWPQMEGVDVRPPVLGTELCKIVGEARWNINLLRAQNARSHNMRSFELVGAGGTQVAPLTGDHRKFLGQDSQTLLFQSYLELEAILRSDPGHLADRTPGLLDGHTYRDRASQLLKELGIS